MLSKEFDLQIAGNGYEAFLWMENHHIPDLIIMDWVMPHMDGKAFLKCIKVSGLYSEIPIIVLSASENVLEEINIIKHPVSKCLSKPFDPILLREAIENILSSKTYGFIN